MLNQICKRYKLHLFFVFVCCCAHILFFVTHLILLLVRRFARFLAWFEKWQNKKYIGQPSPRACCCCCCCYSAPCCRRLHRISWIVVLAAALDAIHAVMLPVAIAFSIYIRWCQLNLFASVNSGVKQNNRSKWNILHYCKRMALILFKHIILYSYYCIFEGTKNGELENISTKKMKT